jgi:perosamine synthetase
MKKYQLAKPNLGKEEEKAVVSVLRSGVLSLGPMAVKFEKEFAKFIGVKYACSVSSGTAGLHLALIAAGIGIGDEVITSPFSFIASSNAIIYVGAKPIFVDVELSTGNLDPKKIEEKITSKTKAILVVHIFGHPADMTAIVKIAKKHNLKIIEDACESLGAETSGKKVGTFGESAVFAFYANKQMTTGEGGMIVTNNRNIYELCLSLRNQGRSKNMQWLDHERLGYNYRMDEMSAAVGFIQIKKIRYLLKERNKIANLYNKYLMEHSKVVRPPIALEGNSPSWFVYVVRIVNENIDRNQIIKALARSGVASKPYLPSIHLFKYYRELFGYRVGMFPNSEKISASSLALPLYIGLTKVEIRDIVSRLISVLNRYGKRI